MQANSTALVAPGQPTGSTSVGLVAIGRIRVDPQRREAVGDTDWLVESIRTVGLLHPIVVSPDGELIAGMHRLVACERLGWTEIPTQVLDLDSARQRLAVLDENLLRRRLTDLEYVEQLAERKQLFEALNPLSKQHVIAGRASAAARTSETVSLVASFAADTANKTGFTKRTIQHFGQIASLPAHVRARIRGTPLATHKRQLLSLARVPPENQVAVLDALAAGTARNVREAVTLLSPAIGESVGAYAVSQAGRIQGRIRAARRLKSDFDADVTEWNARDVVGMRPFLDFWSTIATTLANALEAAPAEIPTEACACGGSNNCSICGGRGWVGNAAPHTKANEPARSPSPSPKIRRARSSP